MNQSTSAAAGTVLDLNGMVKQIQSRQDLANFIRTLHYDLKQRPQEWESRDLAGFLDAIAAWLDDMDGYYHHLGEKVPAQPTWKTLGEVLLAAKVYE